MLHLSLSPCTGSRLQVASSSRHWCLHIEQPQAQHPPTSTHWWQSTSPPEVWDLPSQRGTKSLSRTFSFTVPGWWTIFKRHLKTHLFRLHLTTSSSWTPPPTKQKQLCSLSLTSPCLASVYSEQCLKCCITSTSCDCSPLYNVLLIAFLNCKSLWIKVSAKWINVNVNNSDHCCTIASSELLFYVLL